MATAALDFATAGTKELHQSRPVLPQTHLSLRYVLDYLGEKYAIDLMRLARLIANDRLPETISEVASWHIAVEHMHATNDEAGSCTETVIPR